MAKAMKIKTADLGLVIFHLPDGTETGIGTADELAGLIADDILPVGSYGVPLA